MRQCLWRGNPDTPKQSLAAWPMVCRPKQNGGMGIINLSIQNRALLSKHLFKFYNKADIPWVSLIWNTYYHGVVSHATVLCGSYWWREVLKLNETFRLHSVLTINRGILPFFRMMHGPSWVLPLPSKKDFQEIFSYVLDYKLLVLDFINEQDYGTLFQLLVSPEAMEELQTLFEGIQSLNRDNNLPDSWSWTPGKGIYSAKSYYTLMHSHFDEPCKWLWESRSIMKIKVFAWLLLNDRLNIRAMLVRRHRRQPNEENHCPLLTLEDRDHLFFKCNFNTRVWNYLQIQWTTGLSTRECIIQAKRSFGHSFKVVFLAAWNIWLIRNGKIFWLERPSFRAWKGKFIHDITLLSCRFKASVKPLLVAWIHALP